MARGVEAGCWTLTTEDGKSYSFTATGVSEDQCVEVTGAPGMGFCMQGTQLDVQTLAPSDKDCCKH